MTMAKPVVALAEAEGEGEGCGGLACKAEHKEMIFAGCKMRWPTMHQVDPTPPTMPLLDPEGDDKAAPLCGGGGATACTHTIIRASAKKLFLKSRIAATTMAIPVVALAKAEGCDGLACKDARTRDGICRMQYVVADHAPR